MKIENMVVRFELPAGMGCEKLTHGPTIFPTVLEIGVNRRDGVYRVEATGPKVKNDGTKSAVIATASEPGWLPENWPDWILQAVIRVNAMMAMENGAQS